VLKPASRETNNLDNLRVAPASLPFQLRVLQPEQPWQEGLADVALVMCSLGFEFAPLAEILRSRKVPLLYISELSLRTRLQIVRSSGIGPLFQARKLAWEALQERRYRAALALSAGAQCNGTPTFRAYQSLSPDTLLYFDTRASADMLASDQALTSRFAEARRTRRLRLAFSGRLLPIKGADHLVPLAVRLRERGLDFSFSIYGAGESEAGMRAAIAEHGLEDRMQLAGNLDFATELTPRMRDSTDLFVCCHRQGDPSCTYLETMAVGVPLVGYANEAFAGLLEHVDAGRATAMDDVERLAATIAAVATDRDTLEEWSRNALAFARVHTFERTFARRMAHAQRLANLAV
jgi:glycosyltransferase involved in cell wall biosynthesis